MSEEADLISTETHISRLWLTPDRVYKMLKPVDFEFLDLTDRTDRLATADREIELNRRFSPDVYLGSADVIEQGNIVERMIVMRRLPARRRLSALTKDPDFHDCLCTVARSVATFHASKCQYSTDYSTVPMLLLHFRCSARTLLVRSARDA